MRIRLNDPSQLDELQHSLRAAECISAPLADDTLVVLHPLALDDKEGRMELSFFLKAWQADRPELVVEVT